MIIYLTIGEYYIKLAKPRGFLQNKNMKTPKIRLCEKFLLSFMVNAVFNPLIMQKISMGLINFLKIGVNEENQDNFCTFKYKEHIFKTILLVGKFFQFSGYITGLPTKV